MRISVLDSLEIPRGSNAVDALRGTIRLAQLAEELDLPRYWVVEHHGFGHELCPASDVLIGAIAAATKRLRVGVGGVLLNRHNPYRIAQAFRTLALLHPGRIEIGLGRSAPGLNAERVFERDPTLGQRDHEAMVEELLQWLSGGSPDEAAFGNLRILADQPAGPELWLLAASTGTGELAGRLGLKLASSGFHKPEITGDIAARYYAGFQPSRYAAGVASPSCLVALIAMAAETAEEAARLALPLRMIFDLRMTRKVFVTETPSFEEAVAYFGGVLPPTATDTEPPKFVIGSFEQVAAAIRRIGREMRVDEVMLRPFTTDPIAREALYRNLSRMVA